MIFSIYPKELKELREEFNLDWIKYIGNETPPKEWRAGQLGESKNH